MPFKPLPIGVDDFEEMIEKGYYYVDKTLFIKELLDMKGKVNLFTRPRRFGKTLNLSMLKCFFEMNSYHAEKFVWICIPLMTKYIENLFKWFLAIYVSSFENSV